MKGIFWKNEGGKRVSMALENSPNRQLAKLSPSQRDRLISSHSPTATFKPKVFKLSPMGREGGKRTGAKKGRRRWNL